MKGFKKMTSLKKFLMSLLATTVSIVLTFGTTAIVERKKQKAEKREMVMMVMYDMRESLSEVERCVKDLKAFCDLQVDIVSHPATLRENYASMLGYIPFLLYTNTTENIFKSNIETISTIGNILFVETVSSFYDGRGKFKAEVVDKFLREGDGVWTDYERLAAFDGPSYVYFGDLYLQAMTRDFEECKLIMKVSDEDLDVFSEDRKKLEALRGETMTETTGRIVQEKRQRDLELKEAREEGKKAISQ